MIVANLHIYPVKSTRGRPVSSAAVEPWGLAGDRRWMVVDPGGNQITAREEPELLAVSAQPDGDGAVSLAGPHAPAVTVRADGGPVEVSVFRTPVRARAGGRDGDAWLRALLGRDVRLVWLDDPTRRPVTSSAGRPGDRVSLADAMPLLVTNTASLARLNEWVAEVSPGTDPVDMRRFRPNVVVDGAEPFAEDGWRRVRIGTVDFRVAKLCDRCVMTTIHPDTRVKGPEPLRTLARRRSWDGKVWFGALLVPQGTGTVRVGDAVTAGG